MAVMPPSENIVESDFTENVCFCWICRSLVLSYLLCLAVPVALLLGVLAMVLFAFFG